MYGWVSHTAGGEMIKLEKRNDIEMGGDSLCEIGSCFRSLHLPEGCSDNLCLEICSNVFFRVKSSR